MRLQQAIGIDLMAVPLTSSSHKATHAPYHRICGYEQSDQCFTLLDVHYTGDQLLVVSSAVILNVWCISAGVVTWALRVQSCVQHLAHLNTVLLAHRAHAT